MRITRLIALTAATLFTTGGVCYAQSSAGLFVEPGVTYEMGDSSVDYPSPFSNSSGSVNGFGLMGRGGMHLNEAFFVALDARYSRPQFKDSTNHLKSVANAYQLGPVVGVQMPAIGLRVWAGYVLLAQLDPAESANVDFKFREGTGYQIGAGFRVASLSLNLEYQKLGYGQTDVERVGPLTLGTFDMIKFKNEAFIASVTFPIEL